MPSLRFHRAETALGPMLIAESPRGVAACSRSLSLDAFLGGLARRFPSADLDPGALDASWVDALLDGRSRLLPQVDLAGLSAFEAAVYEVVRSVPRGETVTYGEVARLVGSPGAARAVGGAMARCPLFPAVPCHRVVRAADGWSGWGGDIRLKHCLLEAERAAL